MPLTFTMTGILRLVFAFILLDSQVKGAKILAVIPTPSISHQVIFQPLTQELARRGHDVYVITPNPVFTKEKMDNLTEIDVHNVSYSKLKDIIVSTERFGEKSSVFGQLLNVMTFMVHTVGNQIEFEEVQDFIRYPKKFDLIFIEAWARQALIYSHIFEGPVILASSFGMMIGNEENLGVPLHPVLYPIVFQQRLYNLTFWEKVNMIYNDWWFRRKWFSKEDEEIEIFRSILGRDLPHYDELRNNVDMLFLNCHPLWMNNQPLPPNVISMWGIHKKTERPLPMELQEYFDSSKNGVIYISFGTNAPSSVLPSEFIQLLIRVFSKQPYDVLWKWEKDELPGKSPNIRITKWLPQSDLLRHPKIKLFITQGGLQSFDEALNAGVPLIGIPMLGDQWYNVEKFEFFKIGIKLDMETVNDEQLETAIATVINDKSYRENIKILDTIMKDQPESALSRAVWWTEYVLRHGGAKHLRAPAANMPAAQYYEIQLVLTLFAILIAFLLSLYVSCYFICRKMYSKKIKIS